MGAVVANKIPVARRRSSKKVAAHTKGEKTADKCPYFQARKKDAVRICGNCENLFSNYCKSFMKGVLALDLEGG